MTTVAQRFSTAIAMITVAQRFSAAIAGLKACATGPRVCAV